MEKDSLVGGESMKLSACMCISREGYGDALDSLMRNEPDEILIATKNTRLKNRVKSKIPEANVIVRKRGEPWQDYGKYDLYDMASGEWIVCLNDDDLAVSSYRDFLEEIENDEVGFCFGDRQVYGENIDINDRNYSRYSIRYNKCNHYALRKDCWKDIKESMDTGIVIHDEARVMFWALRKGWKYHYVDDLVVKNSKGSSTPWWIYSPFWKYVYQILERGGDTEEWLLKWSVEDFFKHQRKYFEFFKNLLSIRLLRGEKH